MPLKKLKIDSFIYDYKSLKKIHASTILGLGLNILGILFTGLLIGSPNWVGFLKSLIG